MRVFRIPICHHVTTKTVLGTCHSNGQPLAPQAQQLARHRFEPRAFKSPTTTSNNQAPTAGNQKTTSPQTKNYLRTQTQLLACRNKVSKHIPLDKRTSPTHPDMTLTLNSKGPTNSKKPTQKPTKNQLRTSFPFAPSKNPPDFPETPPGGTRTGEGSWSRIVSSWGTWRANGRGPWCRSRGARLLVGGTDGLRWLNFLFLPLVVLKGNHGYFTTCVLFFCFLGPYQNGRWSEASGGVCFGCGRSDLFFLRTSFTWSNAVTHHLGCLNENSEFPPFWLVCKAQPEANRLCWGSLILKHKCLDTSSQKSRVCCS